MHPILDSLSWFPICIYPRVFPSPQSYKRLECWHDAEGDGRDDALQLPHLAEEPEEPERPQHPQLLDPRSAATPTLERQRAEK
jgi:hypothetical protein